MAGSICIFSAMFGDELVTGLNKAKLEGWLNSLVFKGPDREAVRRSKDTANRVLSIVKALLNHALRDPPMAFRTIMRGGWSSPSAGSRCREQCIFRSSKRACSLKPRPTKISPIS